MKLFQHDVEEQLLSLDKKVRLLDKHIRTLYNQQQDLKTKNSSTLIRSEKVFHLLGATLKEILQHLSKLQWRSSVLYFFKIAKELTLYIRGALL